MCVFVGSQCVVAGTTKLPYGQIPLMLYNGEVTLQTQSGKISTLYLITHNFSEKLQDLSQPEVGLKLTILPQIPSNLGHF